MSRKDKGKSKVDSDVDSDGSEEEEYVVEKIIDRRIKNGKVGSCKTYSSIQ